MNRSCVLCMSKKPHKTRTHVCPGCGLKSDLCFECGNVYVACSKKCREKWRAEAGGGLPKRTVDVPTWAKVKRPEGLAVHQADMFAKARPGVAPLS